MRAIEIITKLRNRYIKKYFMAPENHKAHYISWLQDEYAELRMRQANGDNKSDEECTLPIVSNLVCPTCGESDYNEHTTHNRCNLCDAKF